MLSLPLEISVAEDFYLPIQYQYQLCDNFYPLDISGYVVEMQVGLQPFVGVPSIIDVSSVNGDIIIDGPNGKIEIYIPNTLITPYMFGQWNYAVKVTNTVGLVERLFGGQFTIKGWC